MHSHSIDEFRHAHMFLGEAHERNERKVWIVIAICAAMMALEIVGGVWFGSVALIADGLHMSTHAGALLIAALSLCINLLTAYLLRDDHDHQHHEHHHDDHAHVGGYHRDHNLRAAFVHV